MTPSGTSKRATWHLKNVATALQDVADMKKEINDEDLLALITDEVNQPPQLWALVDLQVGVCTWTRMLLPAWGWRLPCSTHALARSLRWNGCSCRSLPHICRTQGGCHGRMASPSKLQIQVIATDARPGSQPQQGKAGF